MKLERDFTVEVFEMQNWDALTQTVPQGTPVAYRLLHRDGSYIRIGADGYPRRGASRVEAAIWRDRNSALAFSLWWGSTFFLEGGK